MMRGRTAGMIAGVLAGILFAVPVVIGQSAWFSDVPDDHRRIAAIRYAKTEGLFQGFPDGRFGPDEELSEGQFARIVKRLYDRYDVWTRAEWAQVMFAGLPGLTDQPSPPPPAPDDDAPSSLPATTTTIADVPPTTAAPTTTTKPPTVTIPPSVIPDVPLSERDVIVHWFVHPGGQDGDYPFLVLYTATPGGPIPLNPMRADVGGEMNLLTESGVDERSGYGWEISSYAPPSSVSPRSARAAYDVDVIRLRPDYSPPDIHPPAPGSHPFRSAVIVQVAPPEGECLEIWRASYFDHPSNENLIYRHAECHPAEWSEWWGVRVTG